MKPEADTAPLPEIWSPSSVWAKLSRLPWVRKHCLPWSLSLDERFHLKVLGHPLTRHEIGLGGEILAARWLRRYQRKILYRNYRGSRRGEVDIIARHGDTLTFVEVKTRTSSAFGRPADAVNLEKQQLIQRGAQDWMRLLGKPRIAFRFDIVEVLLVSGEVPKLHIVENAFTLPDSVMSGR